MDKTFEWGGKNPAVNKQSKRFAFFFRSTQRAFDGVSGTNATRHDQDEWRDRYYTSHTHTSPLLLSPRLLEQINRRIYSFDSQTNRSASARAAERPLLLWQRRRRRQTRSKFQVEEFVGYLSGRHCPFLGITCTFDLSALELPLVLLPSFQPSRHSRSNCEEGKEKRQFSAFLSRENDDDDEPRINIDLLKRIFISTRDKYRFDEKSTGLYGSEWRNKKIYRLNALSISFVEKRKRKYFFVFLFDQMFFSS